MKKKYTVLLGLLCATSLTLFSQTETKKELNSGFEEGLIKEQTTNSLKSQEKLPSDFPVYKNTGNVKSDSDAFHKAKQKWIKENPKRYEEIKHLNLNVSIYTTKK